MDGTSCPSPRNLALDCWRAIAALVVVVSHVIQIYWWPTTGSGSQLQFITGVAAKVAVLVFFVLSGYLVTRSIANNIGPRGFDVVNYLASRVARLYPPLVVAIVVSIGVFSVISLFHLPGHPAPLRHPKDLYAARDVLTLTVVDVGNALLMNNGLTQVDGPLWSLYVEAIVYLGAGALALALFGRTLLHRLGGGILFLWSCSHLHNWGDLAYGAWWAVGAAVFLCTMHRRARWLLPPILVVLAGAILLFDGDGHTRGLIALTVTFAITALMFSFSSWSLRPLSWVADFSYTLYLIHFPVLVLAYSLLLTPFMNSDAPPLWLRLTVSLMAAAAAVVASYLLAKVAERTAMFKRLLLWAPGRT